MARNTNTFILQKLLAKAQFGGSGGMMLHDRNFQNAGTVNFPKFNLEDYKKKENYTKPEVRTISNDALPNAHKASEIADQDFIKQQKFAKFVAIQNAKKQAAAEAKWKALPKEEQDRILYEEQVRKQGSITTAEPEESAVSRAWHIASHPMTAFGYAARNESLPGHFERGIESGAIDRNAFDHVIDLIPYNAVAKANAGYGVVTNGMNAVGNFAEGNWDQAGQDLSKATLEGLKLVPGGRLEGKALSPILSPLKAMLNSPIAKVPGLTLNNIGLAAGITHGLTEGLPKEWETAKSFYDNPNAQDARKFIGNGLLTTAELAPGYSMLKNANIPWSIDPELRQGLHTNGPSLFNESSETKPWVLHEPESNTLQIKSTMKGSPFEKQLSKNGEINVTNIKTHISKADVSQQDKYILDKVLNEKFPNQARIDYNDFKNAVSDELVVLEKSFDDAYSSHGVKPLGFNGTKKSSYEMAINNVKADIDTFTKKIAEYENKIKTNAEAIGGTSNENMLEGYKERLKEAELQLAKNESEYATLPLENQTIVYGNKSEFGEGSTKHFPNKKEALGHARTLVTQEEPDIMHILESQSDWAQGDGASVLQRFKGEKGPQTFEQYDKALQSAKSNYENSAKALEDLKYRFDNGMPDVHGNQIYQYGIDNLQHMADSQKTLYEFKQANIKNWEQKMHFGKNHLERLLQENVVHAAEQGKTKMRYPTSETAVKIQGYEKKPFEWKRGEPVVLPNGEAGTMNNEVLWDDIINVIDKNGKVIEVPANEFKQLNPKFYNEDFTPKHKTILKKYEDTPKMIKKVLGVDTKLVTDAKGNSWYEFEVPEAYRNGKAEIKAFKYGGMTHDIEEQDINAYHTRKELLNSEINKGYMSRERAHQNWTKHLETLKEKVRQRTGQELYIPHDEVHQFNPAPPVNEEHEQYEELYADQEPSKQEQGGMQYVDRNRNHSHEQSMNKYMFPKQSLLKFMKNDEMENGGLIPFHTYYQQTIVRSRNKS